MTTDYNKTDGLSPTKRRHNSRKTQSPISLRPPYPPTYIIVYKLHTEHTKGQDAYQLQAFTGRHIMVPKTTAYKQWNCQVIRPANCCHLIPSNRFLDGFPDPSKFVAAKLTHYSTMPNRPSDSSQPRQGLLLSGDVHQYPGPATKYPCSVCTSNVTSRGASYMSNRCSGWVHSKCSGLQNAAEYRRIKNWACSSCSSTPTSQIPKPLPSPITTKASDGDPFTILQFNANGIGNKQVELGKFLEQQKFKVAVIQESKLTLNSPTLNIQHFSTVRKDHHQGQRGGLLTLIHKLINFSRRPDTLAGPYLEKLTITAKLGNTDLIITNVYKPPASSCTGGYNPSLDHLMMTTDTLILGDFNLTTHRGIQVLQIREALCWGAWCLALTSVFSTGILQQDCRVMPTQVPLMSH